MEQHTNRCTGVVVLAAGGSRRMGEQKLLKRFAGVPLIRRAAETALKSRADRVLVVLGSDAAQMRSELDGLPVELAENQMWQEGQGTSVACGAWALRDCGAVIFMAADQPFVKAEHLNRLLDAWSEAGDVPIYASLAGGVRGNPSLFDRSVFPELEALTGDRGAKVLFERYEVRYVEQREEHLFLDTDTEALFCHAEREWLLNHPQKEGGRCEDH